MFLLCNEKTKSQVREIFFCEINLMHDSFSNFTEWKNFIFRRKQLASLSQGSPVKNTLLELIWRI